MKIEFTYLFSFFVLCNAFVHSSISIYIKNHLDSFNAGLDIHHKYKKFPFVDSYYESIGSLCECAVIPVDFTYNFAKIASVRNFLAYHCEKVNYIVTCEKSLNIS